MIGKSRLHTHAALGALLLFGASTIGASAADYHPMDTSMAGTTVTLTGHDLTIEQLVQIARHGAKVQLSPEAKQRQADTWGLMMEGATEGMPIYLFNRGAGGQREVVQFEGDPLSDANRPRFTNANRNLGQPPAPAQELPQTGPITGEVANEDVARAIMLIRANQLTYLPASPPRMQALIDLINADITPVMRDRAGTGEALNPVGVGAINATISGNGEAYYHGVRMNSIDALTKAGLKPVGVDAGDQTTNTVNSDVAAMAALLVYDSKNLLDWADLAYAMDLNGMNSSITPLFMPVQANRPYKWINWDAARVLDMLKGSYLFDEKYRIIQDPESLRAGYVRQGSAWQAWGALKDDVVIQMNWSEHNPAVKIDVSPKDSWELSTPEAMKHYVKGGKESNGKHGFIFSNANWDPYPLGNSIEAFTIALANMDIMVVLRQERFASTFFTVDKAQDIMGAPAGGGRGGRGGAAAPAGGAAPADGAAPPQQAAFAGGGGGNTHEAWQRIQGLMNPVPPEGYGGGGDQVEELDAETLFKVTRATNAVKESWTIVANDFGTGARWMEVRKKQDPSRAFGTAPTAALDAFQKAGGSSIAFVLKNPASNFYTSSPAMPQGLGPSALAEQSKPVKRASN